jgi:hypothetical protein
MVIVIRITVAVAAETTTGPIIRVITSSGVA